MIEGKRTNDRKYFHEEEYSHSRKGRGIPVFMQARTAPCREDNARPQAAISNSSHYRPVVQPPQDLGLVLQKVKPFLYLEGAWIGSVLLVIRPSWLRFPALTCNSGDRLHHWRLVGLL
jgi:hypothetical protein